MAENLTILLFAPHSAIWVHAFPEALIAESLEQGNHRIVYVTCSGEFHNYCVCMSAYGLDQNSPQIKKKSICKICNKHKEIIKENFKVDGYDIGDFIEKIELDKIDKILQKITLQNFLDLKLDGLDIGRTALYELLLQYKKNNLIFSENEWDNYLIALRNTLISFFASQKIIDKEMPDRVLVYNSLYAVNRVCCQLAESRGIPTYFLHAGQSLSNRLETMLIGAKYAFPFNQKLRKYWETYKSIPCIPVQIRAVTDHFLELFKGRHFLAYSSTKQDRVDIRNIFKINEGQKILVATMSSYDERFSSEIINVIPKYDNLIFPEQIDWIKFLIEFAKYRQDIFLIIRVHPREFPNKRDSMRSQHSVMLEKVLINLPTNVKLNLPEDNLSIYDLAEYTDLFLNAWSSVGEEMSLLGIPVLIYSDDLVAYPSDINYVANSQEDFCNKIDIALKDGWSFERIRKAYRWYVLKLIRSAFDISDSIQWYRSDAVQTKTQKSNSINLVYRVYRKILLKIFGVDIAATYESQIQDCKTRQDELKCKEDINKLIQDKKDIILEISNQDLEASTDINVETEYIKSELSRLINIDVEIEKNTTETLTPLRRNLINFL
ncbi:MAG: capsule biosynthesis protein [Pseudanabaena sp.]